MDWAFDSLCFARMLCGMGVGANSYFGMRSSFRV